MAMKLRGISDIIATVLIIAITLIAAVAIGGFVFGIFGSASVVADVSVKSVTFDASDFKGQSSHFTCSNSDSNDTSPSPAYLSLDNVGTAAAVVTGVTIVWDGANNAYIPAPYSNSCVVGSAGSATSVVFLVLGPSVKITALPIQGHTFQGYVTLSNGAEVLFTGTWQ